MSTLSNCLLPLLSIFIASICLSSCNSDSTGPGTTTSLRVPVVGSYFTTEYQTIDSNGAVTSHSTNIDTIFQSRATAFGKTNVVSWGSSEHLSYRNYEPNGDISNFNPLSSEWGTYPYASQNRVTLPTILLPGYRETSTAVGAGTGSVTIRGQTFLTEKLSITTLLWDTISGFVIRDTIYNTSQFAPQLGWEVEAKDSETWHLDGQSIQVRKFTLTDYKLY